MVPLCRAALLGSIGEEDAALKRGATRPSHHVADQPLIFAERKIHSPIRIAGILFILNPPQAGEGPALSERTAGALFILNPRQAGERPALCFRLVFRRES